MKYLVSKIDTLNSNIVAEVGRYGEKVDAMKAAKRAAHTRRDCVTYGPSSIAYVGREITAVVSW